MMPIGYTIQATAILLPLFGGLIWGRFYYKAPEPQVAGRHLIMYLAFAIGLLFAFMLPPLNSGTVTCVTKKHLNRDCGDTFTDSHGMTHSKAENLYYVGTSPTTFWINYGIRAFLLSALVAGAISSARTLTGSDEG